MRILVTGFNRFGGLDFNPTELMMPEVERAAAKWSDCTLITEVLATEYSAAESRIRSLVAQADLDAVIGFGVAASAPMFLLERFALNIDDTAVPDNSGWVPSGLPIVPKGPIAYESTLPLPEILAALRNSDIPSAYSNHAGTYVCNHTFYVARHQIDLLQRRIPCGFIHIPLALEASECKLSGRAIASKVLAGVQVCLDTLRRHLREGLRSQSG